jgi:hypothetical protein
MTIDAPPAARTRLYYIYVVWCDGTGQGGTEHPSLGWQAISGTTLNAPGCPGTDETCAYSVGAPGYAIASGTL